MGHSAAQTQPCLAVEMTLGKKDLHFQRTRVETQHKQMFTLL
jgi:hypothetical protein